MLVEPNSLVFVLFSIVHGLFLPLSNTVHKNAHTCTNERTHQKRKRDNELVNIAFPSLPFHILFSLFLVHWESVPECLTELNSTSEWLCLSSLHTHSSNSARTTRYLIWMYITSLFFVCSVYGFHGFHLRDDIEVYHEKKRTRIRKGTRNTNYRQQTCYTVNVVVLSLLIIVFFFSSLLVRSLVLYDTNSVLLIEMNLNG